MKHLILTNTKRSANMVSRKLKIIFIILILGTLITACNSAQTTSDDHHGHEEHTDHDNNMVSLSQAQMDAIDLKIVNIEDKSMNIDIQVNGTIELPPQHKADISPVMGGIVKNIYVIEGDKVKKGQTLATLQHPDFIQLQQDYMTNLNNFEFTEKEYFRQQKLNSEKVTSDKSFQKITSEYKNLKSTLSALKIKLQMLGLNIKGIEAGKIYSSINIIAPFNGSVSAIETNIGSYVEPMSKLFEVVNNDELHADFMVYEQDISKISIGQKLYFSTASINTEFEGIIHNISPVFEDNPKALHIHADISTTKENLIPGMYISGRIIADNVKTTVVPQESIVQENGKYYIFIKRKESIPVHNDDHGDDHDNHNNESTWTFEKVEVIKGVSNDYFTEIKVLSPLGNQNKIVGNGAYFLLAEMGKAENEHVH
jgi:cobalt-zinc-cadmium efflux system membrane fusion protein